MTRQFPIKLVDYPIFLNNYDPLYQGIVEYGYEIENQPLNALEEITCASISKGIKTERFEKASVSCFKNHKKERASIIWQSKVSPSVGF